LIANPRSGESDAMPATGASPLVEMCHRAYVQLPMAPGQPAVGTVAELWRYPVKSMLGTPVSELTLTPHGSLGDRILAVRDLTTGRIASCKRFPQLLTFRATFDDEPTTTRIGRVRIEGPDGSSMYADDPVMTDVLSEVLGRPVRLDSQPRPDEKTGIERGTVFGDVPISEMKPDWTPETMPDYFQLKSNSFFEIGAVALLATGSIERLRRLQGGTAQIDRRRFRPNVVVDTGQDADRFVEEEWIGGRLRIGTTVTLGDFEPILWCVTSTLAQEDLPRDLSVLRTLARQHGGCLGIYAGVKAPGSISVGDSIVLDDFACRRSG
jgi:uncharacterized protein YcbX